MANTPISKQALIDAQTDADSIAKFVNGGENEEVEPRLGDNYPTARNVVKNVASNVLDALVITTSVFASTGAGLAATVSGQFFSVLSASMDEYVILYQNVTGAAVEQRRYPSYLWAKALSDLVQTVFPRVPGISLDPNWPWVISGNNKLPVLGVRRNGAGELVASGVFDKMPGVGKLGDFKFCIFDKATKIVIFGIKWSGEIVTYPKQPNSQNTVFVWEDGKPGQRDIWALVHGIPYQITSSGDNAGPSAEEGVISYIGRNVTIEAKIAQIPVDGSVAPYVTRVIHAIYNGQSLQCGINSGTPITTQFPAANRLLTLKAGVQLVDEAGVLTSDMVAPFVPLIANVTKEPPCLQAASWLAHNRGIPANAALLTSMHGRGAQGIQTLNKGSVPYGNSITAMTAAKAECDTLGYGYDVPFVGWNQGQHDGAMAQGVYLGFLKQLQIDYDADIKNITGIDKTTPVIITQMSQWTAPVYNRAFSWIPHEQLQAYLDEPTKFVIAGPQYAYPHNTDGIHMPAMSYARDAVVVAQAEKATIAGEKWIPTLCLSAKRDGNKVYLKFNVPQGPIVIDTVNVSDPGQYGIRWIDDSNSATVTSVKVSGFSDLEITLSGTPTGANPKIGIADIGIAGNRAGPTTGPRSCIRDSSDALDLASVPVYNWACHQQINVV